MPHRQVGERQVDPAALHELPRGADRRARRDRRPPRGRRPAPWPQPGAPGADPADPPPCADGVPGVQPVPAPQGDRQPDRGPDPRQGREAGRGRGDRGEVPRQGRPRREAGRVPGAPVRRPEAARRDRPGADDGAQGPAVRRADLRARPHARRRGPQRDGGPGSRGRNDDRGHPRDGVRPRSGGPRLLHRGGRVRRGRPAGRGDRQPPGSANPRLPCPDAGGCTCPPAGGAVHVPDSTLHLHAEGGAAHERGTGRPARRPVHVGSPARSGHSARSNPGPGVRPRIIGPWPR